MLARMTAIRDGIGIGYAAAFLADRDPALERLGEPFPSFAGQLWLLVHVDLRRNARVRAFVDFVYDALLAQRSRFEAKPPPEAQAQP